MYPAKLNIRPSEKKFNGQVYINIFEGTKLESEHFVERAKERTGQGSLAYRIIKCPKTYHGVRDNPYTVYARRIKRK